MLVKFTAWAKICAFQTAKLALGPTEPPIEWVRESHSLVIKQLVCKVDSATTSHAVIKDEWSCMSPASICLCGRDRFNFTFTSLLMQAQNW